MLQVFMQRLQSWQDWLAQALFRPLVLEGENVMHPQATVAEYEAAIERLDLSHPDNEGPGAYGGLPCDAYFALGLVEESGEAAGKIKKFYRDGRSEASRMALAYELGDALWYLTRSANIAGFSLYDIMGLNLQKLRDRKARGVQRGSGDSR